jgi:hypothetical protein
MRALIIAAVLTISTSPAQAGESGCRTVYGRMSLANGNPSVRIWVVGTDRVLGVVQQDESFGDLPENIRHVWAAHGDDAMWSSYLFGDFNVCPVTKSKPGRMQFVSVKQATSLRVRQKPDVASD